MVRELRELVLSFFLTAVCEVRGDEPQGRAMDCDFANGGASLFARVKGLSMTLSRGWSGRLRVRMPLPQKGAGAYEVPLQSSAVANASKATRLHSLRAKTSAPLSLKKSRRRIMSGPMTGL